MISWLRRSRLLLVLASLPSTMSAHAAPALEIYGRLPGFETAALSPSGEHAAMIGAAAGKRYLVIVDKAGTLVQRYGIGEAKVLGLHWAGDGMILLHTSNTAALGLGYTADKAELQSVLVVPVGDGKAWSVFDHSSNIVGGIHGFYGLSERDGKWFGYFGGITLDVTKAGAELVHTRPVLYEVDLQTGKTKFVAPRTEDQQDYRTWQLGGDGRVRATFDFRSADGVWTIRNDAGQKIASGVDKLGAVNLVGFGQTPETIIYSTRDAITGQNHWFEVPLAGGAAKELTEQEKFGASYFDNRTHQLIGYRYEGDVPSYHFVSPFQDKVMAATLKAFPALNVRLVDWNDAFDKLIVRSDGVGDPGTWWTVAIRTGKAEVLGTSYAIKADDVGPMRMVHYKASDGLDLAAVLTLPPGRAPKNLPVIILPHGGPAARDYPQFDWWAQAFASQGYAVLQPNFRGSTGYGAEFEIAGHGEWGRKMQTDISDGLAQLIKDGIADPKRACIVGASFGGYAALAGVTLQHGLYRCAVSVAGISDVQKMVSTDIARSGDNQTTIRGLKDEVGSGRDLKTVSPIHFVDGVDAPVMLIHGKDDTVVLYDQSKNMADALRKAGKTTELVTLPIGDHWLLKSEMRLLMLQSAVSFVQKYNPADAPAPLASAASPASPSATAKP